MAIGAGAGQCTTGMECRREVGSWQLSRPGYLLTEGHVEQKAEKLSVARPLG